MYLCVYIYIYIERERDRYTCTYIYIYMRYPQCYDGHEIVNQGDCASSWAVAAVGAISLYQSIYLFIDLALSLSLSIYIYIRL